MKKNIIYTGILAVGLLFGWFLFGGSSVENNQHDHEALAKVNQKWTCSMHPQIMQPEPGDCPICGMDLIPAEVGAEGLAANQFKLTENAMALANIQTTIVGSSEEETTKLKISGKIVENEETSEILSAHFNGRIEDLYITFLGEKVQKGQAVAEIYSSELVNAQQELLTAYKMKNTQPSLYKAVQNKFKNWQIDEKHLEEIVKTGKIKNSFTIYAKTTGIISEIFVSKGAHIMVGKPIFKIANLNTVWAELDVYENQVSLFHVGQKIEITTNANLAKKHTVAITFINPVLNANTRTVKIRTVLNNDGNSLKPGMFVEGIVETNTATKNSKISIPASAVLWTGKRSVVYVKATSDQPIFEIKQIQLGLKNGINYEVISGLKTGDEIVTNGAFTVDAAAQLQGKKSMMNTSGKNEEVILNERIKVNSTFQEQLSFAFNAYEKIKNGLVKDDAKTSNENAKELLISLDKVDIKLIKENDTHQLWMSLEKEIKTATLAISKTENIIEQRSQFIQLSSHFITAVQLFGINKKVYRQFCPMANNNEGAFWLSFDEKIMNPYFGDAMLTCGEVKEIIN